MEVRTKTPRTYSVGRTQSLRYVGVRDHLHHQTRSRLTRIRPAGTAALQRGGGTGPSNTRGLVGGWGELHQRRRIGGT